VPRGIGWPRPEGLDPDRGGAVAVPVLFPLLKADTRGRLREFIVDPVRLPRVKKRNGEVCMYVCL